ncbi:MAG: deoxyribonuclease IV [Halanaerobiaceae bacterium]
MKLGKHVSISGGIDKSPARADEIGCNCLQIFLKNPRGWKARKIDDEEILRFNEEMKKHKMKELVVHSTYLINLATPKDELWEKSIAGLLDDYQRCGYIGADYLVLHPGSHTGSGVEEGISRIAEGLNKLFAEVDINTKILLENVSGAGTAIGSNFQEIHDIIKKIDDKKRVGLCLDTCHAFSAGYNIGNKENLEKMLDEIDENVGLEKLRVIHINDSKYDIATNKDEHAHIGKGYIGKDGFKTFINHPELRELTFILETPQFDGDDEDVEILFELYED